VGKGALTAGMYVDNREQRRKNESTGCLVNITTGPRIKLNVGGKLRHNFLKRENSDSGGKIERGSAQKRAAENGNLEYPKKAHSTNVCFREKAVAETDGGALGEHRVRPQNGKETPRKQWTAGGTLHFGG